MEKKKEKMRRDEKEWMREKLGERSEEREIGRKDWRERNLKVKNVKKEKWEERKWTREKWEERDKVWREKMDKRQANREN